MRFSLKSLWLTLLYCGFATNFVNAADNYPDCFRVDNREIIATNESPTLPQIRISNIRIRPDLVTEFISGEKLNVEFDYEINHCRPVYIFVYAEGISSFAHQTVSHPSPIYGPGKIQGRASGFIYFAREDSADEEINSIDIHGFRIHVKEYASQKVLAEYHHNYPARWDVSKNSDEISDNTVSIPYVCGDDFDWPEPAMITPGKACGNASDYIPAADEIMVDKIDLNNDGICEVIVAAHWCLKHENNICYLIYEETASHYRQIFIYYNRLEFLEYANGYPQLKSEERWADGHEVARFGRYQSRAYKTTVVKRPCK